MGNRGTEPKGRQGDKPKGGTCRGTEHKGGTEPKGGQGDEPKRRQGDKPKGRTEPKGGGKSLRYSRTEPKGGTDYMYVYSLVGGWPITLGDNAEGRDGA